MEANTRVMLALISGAAAGALIGFALTKEKYELILEEELANQRVHYENKLKPEPVKEDTEVKEEVNKEPIALVNYATHVSDYDSGVADEVISKERDFMDNLSDEEQEDFDPLDTEYFDDCPEESGDRSYERPFIITQREFDEEYIEHDKLTISYYNDDVLSDEQEDIIPDVDNVIGVLSLDYFGRDVCDPDVIYVRNLRLGADYEVCRVAGSYKELILGFEDGE